MVAQHALLACGLEQRHCPRTGWLPCDRDIRRGEDRPDEVRYAARRSVPKDFPASASPLAPLVAPLGIPNSPCRDRLNHGGRHCSRETVEGSSISGWLCSSGYHRQPCPGSHRFVRGRDRHLPGSSRCSRWYAAVTRDGRHRNFAAVVEIVEHAKLQRELVLLGVIRAVHGEGKSRRRVSSHQESDRRCGSL